MKILITGGAGFIGSSLIRYLVQNNHEVINLDKLTYAGNLESLHEVQNNPLYKFEHIDICNYHGVVEIFANYKPEKVMHLAAESHVDRSIEKPDEFIETNVIGTFTMLQASLEYWKETNKAREDKFIFHHISTDEVYGDLGHTGKLFTEKTSYKPSSPYSASKAASDHLVRAWGRTYGLPTVITNCSNNYGPFQFPEKLIPLVILNCIEGKKIPIYGKGDQVRDWLYVEDHAKALLKVLTDTKHGETYNIGGHNEKRNIEVVHTICEILDELILDKPNNILSFKQLIEYAPDRQGHDLRYAIDASKIQNDIGWQPLETFKSGILKTVQWYLNNQDWCKNVRSGDYKNLKPLNTSNGVYK